MPVYQGTAVRTSCRVLNFRVETDSAALARDKIIELAMNTDFGVASETCSDYEVDNLEEVDDGDVR